MQIWLEAWGQSKIPFNCVTMVVNCKLSHYQIVQFQAIVSENLVPYPTSKYLHCAYLKLHMICRAPLFADFSSLPVSYTKALKTERFAQAALVHESKATDLTERFAQAALVHESKATDLTERFAQAALVHESKATD